MQLVIKAYVGCDCISVLIYIYICDHSNIAVLICCVNTSVLVTIDPVLHADLYS